MKPVPVLRNGTLFVLLSAALLGGCASTGGLHPTATPVQPGSLHAQRTLAGVTQDASAWPQVDARVAAALAAAGAADAARKPTLNGGASAAGARVPPLLPPLASGHFGVIRYGFLSFKWDLDLWGGKRAA